MAGRGPLKALGVATACGVGGGVGAGVGTAVGVSEPPQALSRVRQSKADVLFRIDWQPSWDRPEGRVQKTEPGLWRLADGFANVQSS